MEKIHPALTKKVTLRESVRRDPAEEERKTAIGAKEVSGAKTNRYQGKVHNIDSKKRKGVEEGKACPKRWFSHGGFPKKETDLMGALRQRSPMLLEKDTKNEERV